MDLTFLEANPLAPTRELYLQSLLWAAALALACVALLRLIRARHTMRPASAWAAAIILLPLIGPALFLVVERSRRA